MTGPLLLELRFLSKSLTLPDMLHIGSDLFTLLPLIPTSLRIIILLLVFQKFNQVKSEMKTA